MNNGLKQTKKRIYCAVYCRKSIEERSDETFGSIENQHESILSFIASHKHEGWVVLSERYDDNGFTGSNINRPSLQKLINDIKEGKINMVIVYKLDRLSRSLVDFVQILKFFEEHGVAFASITQPIDTSTSTCKLMLHILSSFAEFERQLISERTKDKMSAAPLLPAGGLGYSVAQPLPSGLWLGLFGCPTTALWLVAWAIRLPTTALWLG